MSRVLTDALTKLVAANGKLASTQLTPAQREALASLARLTGSVSQSPQGRGSVYQIIDWPRVELELKSLRPISTENLPNNCLNEVPISHYIETVKVGLMAMTCIIF